jgi:hypothetical protein
MPRLLAAGCAAAVSLCTGISLADLNLLLGELAREGRIRITGEMISLI